jgi:RimJ/RimL family protein N-acetyltransferase
MTVRMPFKREAAVQTTSPSVGKPELRGELSWTSRVPELANNVVTLREVRRTDAPSLFTMLTTPEVRRYMSPPPIDIAGFERFIEWAQAQRRAGRYLCFAVIPKGYDVPIGIVQVRQVNEAFTIGEWGAALGSQFWGTGIFEASAHLLFDFVFDRLGLHRLEARAAVQNGRANGAVRKLGSVPEGVVRQGLKGQGRYYDQLMWSLLAEDWQQLNIDERPMVH